MYSVGAGRGQFRYAVKVQKRRPCSHNSVGAALWFPRRFLYTLGNCEADYRKVIKMQEWKFKDLLVNDIEAGTDICLVKKNQSIDAILSLYNANKAITAIYVTDNDNRLVGRIEIEKLLERFFPLITLRAKSGDFRSGWVPQNQSMTIEEIMDKNPVYISPESPVEDALMLMIRERLSEIPVVDACHHPTGRLKAGSIISRCCTADCTH